MQLYENCQVGIEEKLIERLMKLKGHQKTIKSFIFLYTIAYTIKWVVMLIKTYNYHKKNLSFFVYLSLNLNPILKLILCTPPTKQTTTTRPSFCYCFFHIKIQTKQVWFDTLTRLIKKRGPFDQKNFFLICSFVP